MFIVYRATEDQSEVPADQAVPSPVKKSVSFSHSPEEEEEKTVNTAMAVIAPLRPHTCSTNNTKAYRSEEKDSGVSSVGQGTNNTHTHESFSAPPALDGPYMHVEEVVDPSYIPTHDDVMEYARFLGLDPVEDAALLWIAREGLFPTPLPSYWQVRKHIDSDFMEFVNMHTGEVSCEHPNDVYYRQLVQTEKEQKIKKAELTYRYVNFAIFSPH